MPQQVCGTVYVFSFVRVPLDDFCDLGLPVSHAFLFISQLPHLILQLAVGAVQLLKHAGQLRRKHTHRKEMIILNITLKV